LTLSPQCGWEFELAKPFLERGDKTRLTAWIMPRNVRHSLYTLANSTIKSRILREQGRFCPCFFHRLRINFQEKGRIVCITYFNLHFVIRGPTNIYGGRFCEREYAQLYVKQLGSI
jgi:hypothetical protein